MFVDSFFRKTNNTMNRLIWSHMKPRQVGKHVVETFKVQIQQFLQCALTIEVRDERRRAETLSKLVNNSSEATGSTLMRACTWTPDPFILVRRRRLARHNCHYRRIIWETWKCKRKWLATSEGTRDGTPRRRRSSDYGMWFRVAICLFWKRNTDN